MPGDLPPPSPPAEKASASKDWLSRHLSHRVHFLDKRKRCELAHIAVARPGVTLILGNELKSAGGPNESRAGRSCLTLPFDYRPSS
jgi:hypothetical protein